MIFSDRQIHRLYKAFATVTKANPTSLQTTRKRPWIRNVSHLGNKPLKDALEDALGLLCPQATWPLDIEVQRFPGSTEVRVNIRNLRLDLMGFASPEDFGGDLPATIVNTLTDLVEDFYVEHFHNETP